MAAFIALEGLDGVGKSTLVKGLAEHFAGVAMSTPGDALTQARPLVLTAFAHDELAKALFYAASVSSQGNAARRQVEQGHWVVMDRYWASTIAYAKSRGVVADLESLSRHFPVPNLTILVHLDEDERRARLFNRDATPEDLETLNPAFRNRVFADLQNRCDGMADVTGLGKVDAVRTLVNYINTTLSSTSSHLGSNPRPKLSEEDYV